MQQICGERMSLDSCFDLKSVQFDWNGAPQYETVQALI